MPILRAGTFNGVDVTADDLRALVRNFTPRVRKAVQPYLRPGHTVMSDGHVIEQPAWGRVEALALHERPGEPPVVWATVIGVPPGVARAIDDGLYHSRSAELEFKFAESPAARELGLQDVEGPILTGVALLGASVPAVTGLEGVINLTNELRHFTTQLEVAQGKTPSRLHCTEASAARDGDQEKNHMNDAMEQLHAMQIASRELKKRTLKLSERLDKFEADNDMITCAFAPAVVSGGVSNLAALWDAKLESQILSMHLNRDRPEDRAKAAREALIAWKQDNPAQVESWLRDSPDEYALSIDSFTPSGGAPGDNPALRQQPSAALNVLTIRNRERYGSAGDITEDRVARLKTIAERRGWNLRNDGDRERAKVALFAESGHTVRNATSFEGALHAWFREHRVVDFSEGNRREAALAVASARPDLVDAQYGCSAAIPSATDIDDRAVAFAEKTQEQLRRDPDRFEHPDRALAEATKRAAQRHPDLIPTYSPRRGE
jgi:hypothetical protein